MKKFSKIISVLLAVIMAFSCVSVVAFAEEKDDYDLRVKGWNYNYELLLNQLFDDTGYTSWNYVNVNENAMVDTMNTWTALALYDEAWKNAVTHHISVEQAELLLLALIERADFFGLYFNEENQWQNRLCFEFVDIFTEILEYTESIEDFLQEVNDILKWEEFAEVIQSEAWGTTFKIIGDITEVAHLYQNYRDQFVDLYARVLSVQLSNQYYIDLIEYVRDTTTNANLKAAADNVIGYMTTSVEDAILKVLENAILDQVEIGIKTLSNLVINSNVYTATVYEWASTVHGVVDSVADFLWNCDEVYPRMETLLASYYFQSAASDWASASYYNTEEDAEKSYFAIDLLITTRKVCEEALIDYKLADNDGAVGRITNELHGALAEDTEVSLAGLEIMRKMMFDLDVTEFRRVTDSVYIYCPVSVDLLDKDNNLKFTLADGAEAFVNNEYGVMKSIYSDFNNDYLKVLYLFDGYRIRLSGTADGYVTLIHKELLDDNTVADWSFTDLKVNNKSKIVFDTEVEGTPTYTYNDGATVNVVSFNDDFIPSQYPEYTAKDVVNAGTDIADKEVKSIWDQIVEFFESIGEWFRKLFGIED